MSVKLAIRSLLLPLSESDEVAAIEIANQHFHNNNIPLGEAINTVSAWIQQWKDTSDPDVRLEKLVQDILLKCTFLLNNEMSESYFELHRNLQNNEYIDHDTSSIILEQAGLITYLAVQEGMSAARITLILSAADNRLKNTLFQTD